MPYVRCSKCDARRTLARHPRDYIRLPRCWRCQRKMHHDPPDRRLPHYRIDHYRTRHERGHRSPTCVPGRHGCSGYSFPHRRGSRYCDHNPRLTEKDLRKRDRYA